MMKLGACKQFGNSSISGIYLKNYWPNWMNNAIIHVILRQTNVSLIFSRILMHKVSLQYQSHTYPCKNAIVINVIVKSTLWRIKLYRCEDVYDWPRQMNEFCKELNNFRLHLAVVGENKVNSGVQKGYGGRPSVSFVIQRSILRFSYV